MIIKVHINYFQISYKESYKKDGQKLRKSPRHAQSMVDNEKSTRP